MLDHLNDVAIIIFSKPSTVSTSVIMIIVEVRNAGYEGAQKPAICGGRSMRGRWAM